MYDQLLQHGFIIFLLRCRENCGGRKKWSQDVVIRADCIDLCKTQYGNAVFSWSLKQVYDVNRVITTPEVVALRNMTSGGKCDRFYNKILCDVCEDSSKCEKRVCLAGMMLAITKCE